MTVLLGSVALGVFTAPVVVLGRSLSRAREFAADRSAAQLTGDPAALVGALETLDSGVDDRPGTDKRSAYAGVRGLCFLPYGFDTAASSDSLATEHGHTRRRRSGSNDCVSRTLARNRVRLNPLDARMHRRLARHRLFKVPSHNLQRLLFALLALRLVDLLTARRNRSVAASEISLRRGPVVIEVGVGVLQQREPDLCAVARGDDGLVVRSASRPAATTVLTKSVDPSSVEMVVTSVVRRVPAPPDTTGPPGAA